MDHTEIVRRGYDEFAETYAALKSTDKRRVAILETFLQSLSNPTRVLDAGCGNGTPPLRRVTMDAQIMGLDFSYEQLHIARETEFTRLLVQADMTELPFQTGVFDAVTAFDSLIHIPLADHQTVLDEFARVLKPSGGVLLSEGPEEFERTTQNWLDSGGEMRWTMAGIEATKDRLREAGFTVTKKWDAPDSSEDKEPEPPFLAAHLDPSHTE